MAPREATRGCSLRGGPCGSPAVPGARERGRRPRAPRRLPAGCSRGFPHRLAHKIRAWLPLQALPVLGVGVGAKVAPHRATAVTAAAFPSSPSPWASPCLSTPLHFRGLCHLTHGQHGSPLSAQRAAAPSCSSRLVLGPRPHGHAFLS